MKRLLLITHLLAFSVLLKASPTEARDAVQASLAKIDQQIAREQQAGNTEKDDHIEEVKCWLTLCVRTINEII